MTYRCSKSFTSTEGVAYYYGNKIPWSEYNSLKYEDRMNFILITDEEAEYRKRRNEDYNTLNTGYNYNSDSSSNYTGDTGNHSDYSSNNQSDNGNPSSDSIDYGGGSSGGGGSSDNY